MNILYGIRSIENYCFFGLFTQENNYKLLTNLSAEASRPFLRNLDFSLNIENNSTVYIWRNNFDVSVRYNKIIFATDIILLPSDYNLPILTKLDEQYEMDLLKREFDPTKNLNEATVRQLLNQ